MSLTRRGFVAGAGSMALAMNGTAFAASGCERPEPVPDGTVRLSGDGVGLSPSAYAGLLDRLTRESGAGRDRYLLGGEVEQFEQYCAALLGKEMAVFMPSGTLANHLAIRAHAGSRRRVIVPETSHVYNDTGDACQVLSGLNLVPLAPGAATFTLDEVESVLAKTAGGRVAAEVGAILIESPVRRRYGELFDRAEALRIATFARVRGIGTHLDGARLFIAAAYTGLSPAELSAPFDTVYVSLWKCFNSGIGAILAGPRSLLGDMYHARRMFGGNLYNGWPAALVAGHYMDGFVERLKSAVRVSENFLAAISAHPKVRVARIPDGSNVARLGFRDVDAAALVERLRKDDIVLRDPDAQGWVNVAVNETWNRKTGAELMAAFERALA